MAATQLSRKKVLRWCNFVMYFDPVWIAECLTHTGNNLGFQKLEEVFLHLFITTSHVTLTGTLNFPINTYPTEGKMMESNL